MSTARWTCLLSCLGALACQGRSNEAGASAPPAAEANEPVAKALPPAPSAAPAAAPAAAAPTAAPSAGGLRWQAPASFERRATKSSMRAAEYGVGGDPSAELTVFYFGPDQGGSVEANVARWIGQISQPDGSDSAQKAKRSTRTVAAFEVSFLELAGNYAGGMAMPGAPPPTPQPDALMLAAIVKGPQGPLFFKLVGARATVERVRGDFDRLIESLEPAPQP